MPRRRLALLLTFVLMLAGGVACDPRPAAKHRPRRKTSSSRPSPTRPEQSGTIPSSGPGSAGDPLLPGQGNSGYDVGHYTLELSYDPDDERLAGTVTIRAVATAALERFHLDLLGMTVRKVVVDGAAAEFARDGRELVVTPAASIGEGREFDVAVTYDGRPRAVEGAGVPFPMGWVPFDGGSFSANEPDAASTWFPANDHPLDKASFTFRVTVPKPYVVAANGLPGEISESGGARTYLWEAADPMAPYLVTVDVGRFERVDSTGPGGLPIIDFFLEDLPKRARAEFAETPEMIGVFSEKFGPYPFRTYGAIVVPDFDAAIESQTRSLFSEDVAESGMAEATVAHELAHQWFGDSVSVARWQDIWLAEGFATFAEWVWEEHATGDGDTIRRDAEDAYAAFADSGSWEPPAKPDVDGLFGESSYQGGALALYALYAAVGRDTFFDILRTYTQRYRFGNATTADFTKLAAEVSGKDVVPVLDEWLYGRRLPPFSR